MVEPVVHDCIWERPNDRFLACNLFKGLRPPFPRDYLVRHKLVKVRASTPEASKCSTFLSSPTPDLDCCCGQTPHLPPTTAPLATVSPFPALRRSQRNRCAEPEV